MVRLYLGTISGGNDGLWEAPGKVSGSSEVKWRAVLKLRRGGCRGAVGCSHLSPMATKVQECLPYLLRAPAPVCPGPTAALKIPLTEHAPAHAPAERAPFLAPQSGQMGPCLQNCESPAEALPRRLCLVYPKCKTKLSPPHPPMKKQTNTVSLAKNTASAPLLTIATCPCPCPCRSMPPAQCSLTDS